MSKLIRVIDNETIEISDYKSPNLCFETNEYGEAGNFDTYCVLKEKINPFSLYVENQRLNNIIDELDKMFDGDLDGFFTINEKGACNDIIEVIQNYKDKLKELKEGK